MAHDVHQVRKFEHPGVGRKRAKATPKGRQVDPTAAHEIEALAQAVGTSARTLSRLFSSQTQLSFKSWCQRARIAAAIERLSMEADVSVKKLASELGYASVPAFSHAFRQVTGKTPTEFAVRTVTRAKAGVR